MPLAPEWLVLLKCLVHWLVMVIPLLVLTPMAVPTPPRTIPMPAHTLG